MYPQGPCTCTLCMTCDKRILIADKRVTNYLGAFCYPCAFGVEQLVDVSKDIQLAQDYLEAAKSSFKDDRKTLMEMAAKKLEHVVKILRVCND